MQVLRESDQKHLSAALQAVRVPSWEQRPAVWAAGWGEPDGVSGPMQMLRESDQKHLSAALQAVRVRSWAQGLAVWPAGRPVAAGEATHPLLLMRHSQPGTALQRTMS